LQLISLLMKRMYWLHDGLQAALEPNGVAPLTRAQVFVIANISAGETKASAIARNLGVSRQAISQIIAELSESGILVVTEDPDDRRSRIAQLAPEFDDEGEVCNRIFRMLEEELGRRIGQRHVKNLHDALESEWGEPPVLGTLPPPPS
jgi:DNA-binding MarR family transcriptional regulator